MDKEKLKIVLDKHEKWLLDQDDGKRANLYKADLHGADLCGVNLRGATLIEIDLSGANLWGVNFCGANICESDLRRADFCGANLYDAILREADLRKAYLGGANLCKASLCDANLCWADLRGTNLCGADLRGADLRGVDIYGADLRYANLRGAKNVPYIPMVCPEEGEFIGWKKANGYLVKLLIPKDAKRSSATTRKCRCNKAKVLEIIKTKETQIEAIKVASTYDNNFIYTLGEWVEVPDFDDDRWNECSTGIHFFMQRQEALNY